MRACGAEPRSRGPGPCLRCAPGAQPGCTVDEEASKRELSDRHSFYCVPLPGETAWAKSACAGSAGRQPPAVPGVPTRPLKRAADDAAPAHLLAGAEKRPHDDARDGVPAECAPPTTNASVAPSAAPATAVSSAMHASCSVPSGANGSAPDCIVKVYENGEQLRVGMAVEFVGVLSIDPAVASIEVDDEFLAAEVAAHMPPTSRVPRLHCVRYSLLGDANPAVRCVDANSALALEAGVRSAARDIRADALQRFTALLGGDALAAEYFLLHLLSAMYVPGKPVGRRGARPSYPPLPHFLPPHRGLPLRRHGSHARHDMMVLGKLSLNISGIGLRAADAASAAVRIDGVRRAIELLLPRSCYLPLSLDTLNGSRFAPHKDYAANRLMPGRLQLVNGTHVIVDETALQEGKVEACGVNNLQVLHNVLLWAKLPFDFGHHQLDFDTDLAVLVLSEGRSMLPVDCHVPLHLQAPMAADTMMLADMETAPEAYLHRARQYFGVLRGSRFDFPDDLKAAIEGDFVAMRQRDAKRWTGDAFSRLLTIARCVPVLSAKCVLDGRPAGRPAPPRPADPPASCDAGYCRKVTAKVCCTRTRGGAHAIWRRRDCPGCRRRDARRGHGPAPWHTSRAKCRTANPHDARCSGKRTPRTGQGRGAPADAVDGD